MLLRKLHQMFNYVSVAPSTEVRESIQAWFFGGLELRRAVKHNYLLMQFIVNNMMKHEQIVRVAEYTFTFPIVNYFL